MKKRFINSSFFVSILLSSVFLLPAISVLAQGGFTLSPVVTRGERVMAGEKGRFFTNGFGYLAGLSALNNQGDVVVMSEVGGRCIYGSYLISKERVIILADYFCHPSPIGAITTFSMANLNDAGQALVLARINHSFQGLFLYDNGSLTKIVAEGDVTPLNTTFKYVLSAFLPVGPTLNNRGEVAFAAITEDSNGQRQDGIFVYANGKIRKIVVDGDASPVFGKFGNLIDAHEPARINDKGEVLFCASSTSDDGKSISYGFFLATDTGIKKVIAVPDRLPIGGYFTSFSCIPDLNNRSEIVFTAGYGGTPDYPAAVILSSEEQLYTIASTGAPTPIGGKFSFRSINTIDKPRINNNSAIAFLAPIEGGSSSSAIFLASKKAMLKVVAVGDKLPAGEKVTFLNQFALNDNGQIAFFAFGRKGKPLGVFLATPVTPESSMIEIVQNGGAVELRVTGNSFITNDTTIEINGVTLEAMSYPEEAREDGGTTRQIISRDARLEQLLTPGQTVQVKVFNSLTNRRSEAKEFTR